MKKKPKIRIAVHKGIIGNEKADELAKKGSISGETITNKCIQPTLAYLYNEVEGFVVNETNKRYCGLQHCDEKSEDTVEYVLSAL